MFGLGATDAKLISRSDNVTGTMQVFETVKKLLPGESITVVMKLELAGTELTEMSPFARPFIGEFKDFHHKNQGQAFYRKIKVVEQGNKSGLASTGATPLGFVALGSLLLAAGLSAFFVARRRRSLTT